MQFRIDAAGRPGSRRIPPFRLPVAPAVLRVVVVVREVAPLDRPVPLRRRRRARTRIPGRGGSARRRRSSPRRGCRFPRDPSVPRPSRAPRGVAPLPSRTMPLPRRTMPRFRIESFSRTRFAVTTRGASRPSEAYAPEQTTMVTTTVAMRIVTSSISYPPGTSSTDFTLRAFQGFPVEGSIRRRCSRPGASRCRGRAWRSHARSDRSRPSPPRTPCPRPRPGSRCPPVRRRRRRSGAPRSSLPARAGRARRPSRPRFPSGRSGRPSRRGTARGGRRSRGEGPPGRPPSDRRIPRGARRGSTGGGPRCCGRSPETTRPGATGRSRSGRGMSPARASRSRRSPASGAASRGGPCARRGCHPSRPGTGRGSSTARSSSGSSRSRPGPAPRS